MYLGLDIGGTSTRALVTTAGGARVGHGVAGAANPVMVPLAEAQANITAAVDAALSGVDRSAVRAAVAGAAGSARFAGLTISWGVPCPVRIVGDVVVAFAAGTAEPAGTVLIAGTGAVAAQVDGFDAARVGDGLGWLLGDLGSAFWLGRAAAAATARTLLAGRDSPLARLVTAAVGHTEPDPFVIALYHRPPRDLATLAPLVTEAALTGDPEALSIVDEAARHLAATVTEIRPDGDPRPIVLSGSVLLRSAPIRDAVRRLLTARWPCAPIQLAAPAEIGAARLAATLAPPGR